MLEPGVLQLSLEEPLAHFARDGYGRLGRVLTSEGARALCRRADALMLGELPDPGLFFQHDSATGRYEDLVFGEGWVGPSLAYRKLEKLERDPLFREWIENAMFARVAHAILGPSVTLYRAVLWTKVGHGGMDLPWHQDDGRFWGLDRPPVLQIWTALDDAPVPSGCVEVLPGSHLSGLASDEGGTVPESCVMAADAEKRAVAVPARTGEVLLIHNHLWHRSGRNTTDKPRRALGVSYLSAETQCRRRRRPRRQFLPVFEGSSD